MRGVRFIIGAAALWLAALSTTAHAQDEEFDLPRISSPYIRDYEAFRLAAAEEAPATTPSMVQPAAQAMGNSFESRTVTPGKVHQYLGLATIAGVVLTTMTAPEDCESNCSAQGARETNGTHAKLAKATLAMAVATVITGILVHHDDIDLAEGLRDPDNLHALLGVTGAALMAYAVNRSKNSAVPISHAGIAETGALLMVAAIKITW